MSLARDIADLGAVTSRLDTVGASSGALSNRNLIINGAMQVAQRGTSATTSGYSTVDRFVCTFSGHDEAPTIAQHTLTSSDTGVYEKGFRESFHITNGNQTSGAGTADRLFMQYRIEAQDIAKSGWDYTSSSSNITLSFYCKSSVAQNFYGRITTADGTQQNYAFETGSLTADTWTKITKTISGNSSITIDDNSDIGLSIELVMFRGTDTTDNSVPLNAWQTYSSSARMPDNTSTWYTTNDATFEITGVQLEVGDTATDFEHRSFGDEMSRCQRFFTRFGGTNTFDLVALGGMGSSSTVAQVGCVFPTRMRATPAVAMTDLALADSVNSQVTVNSVAISSSVSNDQMAWMNFNTSGSITAHRPYYLRVNSNATTGGLKFDAEL